MTFHIEAETNDDKQLIEQLLETCFGPARKGRTVYQFRKNTAPIDPLCLVARHDEGQLLGSIRFWPVALPDGRIIPLLGPLAVDPSCQGQGIGRTLITHGLGGAERLAYDGVLIVGKPNYYAPFGFSEDLVSHLEMPGSVEPLTFMGLEFSHADQGLKCNSGRIAPAGPETGMNSGPAKAAVI